MATPTAERPPRGPARRARGGGCAPDPAGAAATCRICLEGGGELVSPCPCRGSVRFVHEACLKQWLRTRHPALGFSRVRPPKPGACGPEQAAAGRWAAAADSLPAPGTARRGAAGYRCEICRSPYRLVVSPLPWPALARMCLQRFAAYWRASGTLAVVRAAAGVLPDRPGPYLKYAFHAAYFAFLLRKLRQLSRLSGFGHLVLSVLMRRETHAGARAGGMAPGMVLLLVCVMSAHYVSLFGAEAGGALGALQRYRAEWCRFRVLGHRVRS